MPYVFSAANDPASVAAAAGRAADLRSEPERVPAPQENGALLRRVLAEARRRARSRARRGASPSRPATRRSPGRLEARVRRRRLHQRGRLSGGPAGPGRAPAVGHGDAHRRAAAPGRRGRRRGDRARLAPPGRRRRPPSPDPSAVSVTAMADRSPAGAGRALMGVVAASALAYPLLVCAVELVFAQLLTVDVRRDRAAGWRSGCCAASRSSPPSAGARPAGAQPVAAARPRAAGPLRAVADLAAAHGLSASGRMTA